MFAQFLGGKILSDTARHRRRRRRRHHGAISFFYFFIHTRAHLSQPA